MKKKLSDEGLFDITHKKEKPDHIKRIGVVTSKQGAVIHDIINVCSRRDMSVSIILYPVKVQGIGAEIEIARGIEFFNKYNVDAVVVARGGGSLEDLSPFNTEIVARATYNSNKYIVSAVGHETDYTIIDYVSDLRAPTPSAAAELLTIDRSELIENFYNNIFCLKNAYTQLIDFKKQDLGINNAKINNNISFLLNKERDLKISNLTLIDSLYTAKINQESTTVDGTIQLLKTSDPSSILKRGYAKIEKDEKSITSKKQLGYGENIDIIFSDGTISATTYNKGENQ